MLIAVTSELIPQLRQVLEQHAVRTLDAIHIATALRERVDVFVTADERQRAAIEAYGMTVVYVGN